MAIEAGSSAYWQAKRGTVQSGLVGHWDSMAMSSRTGNIVYDLAGNNNGTLTNGATFERIGVGFDGTNDYVSLSKTITIGTPTTFSTWIRTTTTGTRILIEDNNGAQCFISGGIVYMGITNNAGAQVTGVAVNDGKWRHIAAAWISASERRLFVDGNEVGSSLSSQVTNVSFTTLFRRNDGTLYYLGDADDIRIYNRALSANEVSQNFNATRYRFGV